MTCGFRIDGLKQALEPCVRHATGEIEKKAMTLNNHPWLQRILAPLSEEKTTAKVNEEAPLWEEVDSGIARLGSLTHEQVDIPRIQENCLILLEQESKDFRIVIHLIRTLQHGGHPEQVVLASVLLTSYLRHFASTAWPQDARIEASFYNKS
jgi:type VI secretion system protein VasJ